MSFSPGLEKRRSVDCDSGYVSSDSNHEHVPETYFSKQHLKFINSQLQRLPAEDILKWSLVSLPGLFQETAFGLTGLVTLDLLSKMSGSLKPKVDLVFIDTLHHFDETHALVDRVQERYPGTHLHVYKPRGIVTSAEFAAKFGEEFWEKDEERYDYVAKVEPSERAYRELCVQAVLTGRRRGQGDARTNLDIVEVDDTGLIKVNPLANWSFDDVEKYVKENNVPYNELLDRGYKSVGDWHSTQPVKQGEDERAGRWKGREKTECGIHNPKSRYAQILKEMEKAKGEQEAAATLASDVA